MRGGEANRLVLAGERATRPIGDLTDDFRLEMVTLLAGATCSKQMPCDVRSVRTVSPVIGAMARRHVAPKDGVVIGRTDMNGQAMITEGFELIREIVASGGTKYTAGLIDRSRYEALVDLGWLRPIRMNKNDIAYVATEQGIAAAD